MLLDHLTPYCAMKVFLFSELQIRAECSEAKELHEEFFLWCKDQSKDVISSMDTDQGDVNDLDASLQHLRYERSSAIQH